MRTSASVTIIYAEMSAGKIKVQQVQVKLWLVSEGNNTCTSDLSKDDMPEVTSMSKNGLAIFVGCLKVPQSDMLQVLLLHLLVRRMVCSQGTSGF